MAELTTPVKGMTNMPKYFMFPEDPKTSNLTSTCGDEYITVRPERLGSPDSREVFIGIAMDFEFADAGEAWAAVDADELRDAIDKAMGPRGAFRHLGDNVDPVVPASFDEQVSAFQRLALHDIFDGCWGVGAVLVDEMEKTLDKLKDFRDKVAEPKPAKSYRPTDRERMSAEDVVNHPAHYTAYPVEVIELTEHMNFCRGNAVKYIARAGLKNPDTELEDLRKARWYIDREIARLEGPESPDDSPLPGEVRIGPQSAINISTGQPWEGVR